MRHTFLGCSADLSFLEKAIKANEQSLDSVESWLFIATFLVVIGLVLEYWHPFVELRDAHRRRPLFPWKKLLEIMGGVLVVIGVAGELMAQFYAARIETRIRSNTYQIETLLNGKAEKERTARLNLEEDISPRILEQSTSSERLRSFAGTKFAIKVVEGPDLETRRTAGQIALMCNMAGWTRDDSLAALSTLPAFEEGLEVEFNARLGVLRGMPPANSTDEVGSALLEIFRQNKIQANMWPRALSTTMPPLPGQVIIIHVGLKPLSDYFLKVRIGTGGKDENGNSILGNSLIPK
jgi:hypothetical protein